MGMSLVLPSVLQRMADPRPQLAGLTGDAKARFQKLQLDGVQKPVIRAAVINSVLAALLVPFLTPTFGWMPTRVWLAVKLAISLVRVLAAVAYSRSPWPMVEDPAPRQFTLILLGIDGAVWGAAGAWCAFGPSE